MLKKFFVFFYTLLAVEGLLRIMTPVPMMPRYVTASPYGVRSNMANQTYCHTTEEYKILIRTNTKGIRANREIPYKKAPDVKRVVILGDSFGMGYGVNVDEMFTARLVYYLKAKYGLTAEIVNLATSGHGNAEELIILINEGFKYDPDLVLLSWHSTDLMDNVRSNLFSMVDGKLKNKDKTYLPGVKERQFLNQFSLYRFLAEHSQVYNFLRGFASKKIQRWLAKIRFTKLSMQQEKIKQNRQTRKKYAKELTLALLEKIEKECRARNIRFLILDIPVRLYRKEFISKFPYEYTGNANPFAIVSPIKKFKENSGELIYWEKSQGHFTPLGCDLVGEVLAEYIWFHNLFESHPKVE